MYIISGGNQLEIKGSYLQSVQKPLFVVYYNNKNLTAVSIGFRMNFSLYLFFFFAALMLLKVL